MMAPTLATSIRFKIVEIKPDSLPGEGRARWRKEILEKYPGARITAEFPCYTSSLGGTAFDLARGGTNQGRISTRLAFIPLPGGRIEFNLTAPRGKLAEHDFAFANLLTSFHLEPEAAH